MTPAGHAVGNHRGEQRFDGAKQRDGDGVRQHCIYLLDAEGRQGRRRQRARHFAESRRDRRDIERKHGADDGGGDHRDQKGRPMRADAANQQDHGDRENSDGDRRPMNCRQRIAQGDKLWHQFGRLMS